MTLVSHLPPQKRADNTKLLVLINLNRLLTAQLTAAGTNRGVLQRILNLTISFTITQRTYQVRANIGQLNRDLRSVRSTRSRTGQLAKTLHVDVAAGNDCDNRAGPGFSG
jgi:hypothetical protein